MSAANERIEAVHQLAEKVMAAWSTLHGLRETLATLRAQPDLTPGLSVTVDLALEIAGEMDALYKPTVELFERLRRVL